MAIVTKILETLRKNGLRAVKVLSLGKHKARTAYLMQSFGEDSNPVKWQAIYSDTSTTGQPVILGFINPSALSEVAVGEKRIFSTDENGTESFFLHLKNDGTAKVGGEGDFMVRYNELETGFNQLKEDFNNLVSVVNAIRTDQTTFAAAYVPGGPVSVGLPPAYLTTSTPGQSSAASIADSKIDNILTTPKQ